jgi:hypothetical protein
MTIVIPFIILILEARASQELTHDAGGWYLFVADGQEEVDELQQSVGLTVFWTVLGNTGEDNLRMGAQYGKLDIQC